jgi:hypothetical protein
MNIKFFEVGERVEIVSLISGLKHRQKKGKVYGRVTNIDGEYHLVRPMWCTWETELYRNEMRKA